MNNNRVSGSHRDPGPMVIAVAISERDAESLPALEPLPISKSKRGHWTMILIPLSCSTRQRCVQAATATSIKAGNQCCKEWPGWVSWQTTIEVPLLSFPDTMGENASGAEIQRNALLDEPRERVCVRSPPRARPGHRALLPLSAVIPISEGRDVDIVCKISSAGPCWPVKTMKKKGEKALLHA